MKTLLLAPFRLLAVITGQFSWVAPNWLLCLFAWLNQHRRLTSLLVFSAFLGLGIFFYLSSLPKPITVAVDIGTIKLTPNYAGVKPSPLDISFFYDLSVLNEDQLKPEGDPSVARIDLVGQEIVTGIDLSPFKKGTWTWVDDHRIQFVPETDWPAGTDYTVSFDKSVFADQTFLSQDSYSFSTPSLGIKVSSSEFYQDPQDITAVPLT